MKKEKTGSGSSGGRGGKLQRSETVTVRLDPKLRYLAELGARAQRRTLSSFIEWAVEDYLKVIELPGIEGWTNLREEEGILWDSHEGERLCRLAIKHKALLTYEEQELWKLICATGILSLAQTANKDGKTIWNWEALERDQFPCLRSHWDEIKAAVAQDEESKQRLVKKLQEKYGVPF